MKKIFLLLIFSVYIQAQNLEKIAAEIKFEGIDLYRSEMASWYGTDLFLENFSEREKIGGYFSYIDNEVPKCIFFSINQKVIGTISFPTNYKLENAKLDLTERDFTNIEKEYADIRTKSLERINNDTIFKKYNNSNLNIVPIIKNNIKKVYVLTGPSINDVVIFGNDYLITFDKKNEIKNVEKLHKSIIVNSTKDIETIEAGAHSHVLENQPYITPTDICTLMLYEKSVGKMYHVISKKYTSIWNAEGNKLVILTNEVMNKINDFEKKNSVESSKSAK